MKKNLPFNYWSKERIELGLDIHICKNCTSRNKKYKQDKRVEMILTLPLWFVAKYLYMNEGARSPKEFKEIWKEIHPRVGFKPNQMVEVHFGDFKAVKL